MSHSFALLCSWMDWSHFGIQPQFMVLWAVLHWSASHAVLVSFMPPTLSYSVIFHFSTVAVSAPPNLASCPSCHFLPFDQLTAHLTVQFQCTVTFSTWTILDLQNRSQRFYTLKMVFLNKKIIKLTNTNLVTKYIYRTLTENKTNECIKSW